MTNNLYRQGKAEDLKNDYVIFAQTTKGINREGASSKLQEFMRICLKYKPENIGDSQQGTILQDNIDIEEVISKQGDGADATALFTDLNTLQRVVEELIQADLGLCINISGLTDEAQQCCRANGIERHSVEHSLGFWGAKDRLPEREVLEISSLCGHGMVSFNFIRKMIDFVKLRRLTAKEAAKTMGKCCMCGSFSPARAEIVLKRILGENTR